MAKVITSKEINLSQLDEELGSQGLSADFNNPDNKVIVTADSSIVTQEELQLAVDSHIALPLPEPTVEDKLASVGLNLNDLKAALGI
jgi:hypothetical protein